MNKEISRLFTLIMLIASLASASEMYEAEDFGNLSLGRAKKDNVIGLDISPGVFNQLPHYNLTYARITEGGRGEVSFNATYNPWLTGPSQKLGVTRGDDVVEKSQQNKYLMIGGGIKYRVFHEEREEGLFYGVGGHIWLWWWDFVKPKSDNNIIEGKVVLEEEGSEFFQTFIPHGELGYLFPLNVEWSVITSGELGFALSTFDKLEHGNEQQDNIYGDTSGSNMLFWTLNLGLRYAF